MQTLIIEIINENAFEVLRKLQEKHFIKIHPKSHVQFLVLPGKPLTLKEFKDIAGKAETSGSMGLDEAKRKWATKRCQLIKYSEQQ